MDAWDKIIFFAIAIYVHEESIHKIAFQSTKILPGQIAAPPVEWEQRRGNSFAIVTMLKLVQNYARALSRKQLPWSVLYMRLAQVS